eukprot:3263124-Prymnesium_polylepis.1
MRSCTLCSRAQRAHAHAGRCWQAAGRLPLQAAAGTGVARPAISSGGGLRRDEGQARARTPSCFELCHLRESPTRQYRA